MSKETVKQIETEKYNGFKNYETWNVALWISNDRGFYDIARSLHKQGYKGFRKVMSDLDIKCTPDGVAWNDKTLDIKRLDELMREL